MYKTEIYFGRGMVDGTSLPKGQALDFVRKEIVSRFPEGLTVLEGIGYWMYGNKFPEKSGMTVEEHSLIVIIVHKGQNINWENIDLVQQLYKERFDQEATLAISRKVEACFSANFMAERAVD